MLTTIVHNSISLHRIRLAFPLWGYLYCACLVGHFSVKCHADEVSDGKLKEVQATIQAAQSVLVKELTAELQANPNSIEAYSRRGDAYFFLGEFDQAVSDYEKMVDLNPGLASSHWRRGIAYFYAGKFDEAAKQFELYHSFDDVDRENGIWRYLSQHKAYGREKAREGLLKYKKDDREPFPAVYQLFAGKITPAEILKSIQDAKVDEERNKRLFYAELYIGLNNAVENRPQMAVMHLLASTHNRWPQTAGYGPNYMWHVGRLHLIQLQKLPPKVQPSDTKP